MIVISTLLMALYTLYTYTPYYIVLHTLNHVLSILRAISGTDMTQHADFGI